MQNKIYSLIYKALQTLAEELENENLKNPTPETKIYGIDGNLDSLALVSFIADLEEMLATELNLNLVLADEKTMSGRNSPFKDVATLSTYILEKGKENA